MPATQPGDILHAATQHSLASQADAHYPCKDPAPCGRLPLPLQPPLFHRATTDLFKLFRTVYKLGGHDEVVRQKGWGEWRRQPLQCCAVKAVMSTKELRGFL